MITEQETRYTCDGEGRPVKEEFGYNLYHVSEPPPSMVTEVKLRLLNFVGQQEVSSSFAYPLQSAEFDRKTFDDCVSKLFGVTVKFISENEQEFGFIGHSKDLETWYGAVFEAIFGIENGTVGVSIARVPNRELGGIVSTGRVTFGETFEDSPYENKVGNTLGSATFQKAKWVYELGNALGFITGKKPIVKNPSRYGSASEIFKDDVGGALEDCVYGGRLNLDGRISPP